MIIINDIKDIPVRLYYQEEDCIPTDIGVIDTYLQLEDARLQIAKEGIDGYFIVFYGEDNFRHVIDISHRGDLSDWPKGLFDILNRLFAERISLRIK